MEQQDIKKWWLVERKEQELISCRNITTYFTHLTTKPGKEKCTTHHDGIHSCIVWAKSIKQAINRSKKKHPK